MDQAGTSGSERVRESFRRQAASCRSLGSPFTAAICDLLAERLDGSGRFGRRVLDWAGDPQADALALRAAGGLHALARSGRCPPLTAVYPPRAGEGEDLWRGLAAALGNHDAFLHDYLDSPPQTNEVKRCGALLGGCLLVAAETRLPLRFLEIGSSAGLNLGFDRYRYELGEGRSWGDRGSGVVVRCEWRGAAPSLKTPLAVADRAGSDPSPLDPSSPPDRERLLSYVWADEVERLDTTEKALDAAAAAPWRVERADGASFVEERLSEGARGRARVLAHTIVWRYLPEEIKARIERAVRAAGERATADAPVAWLRVEGDGGGDADVSLTLWPGGDDRALGRADVHGRWVHWT